ncbi:MAG: HAD-IB family phosphatase, partial [Pseudomonadota bacterium]
MGFFMVMTASRARGVADLEVMAVASKMELTPRRLGRHGVEFACESRPPMVPDIPGIDINTVPAAKRRKRLLIADMDSTMIPVECIDEVADYAGVRDQVVAITEPAMRGEISFEDALCARVALMQGLNADRLAEVYAERVALNPGGRTLVQTMRANGAHTALVSGGFTYFTERVAAAAGFDENRANRL